MSQIVWDDKLSVHVQEIDDQHKKLIEMINRLDHAVEDGSWSKKIVILSDVLLEMIDYLDYHFTTEEKYMIDNHFPQFEAHREEHRKFVDEVAGFANDFRNGTKGLSKDLLEFLKDWLLTHVTDTDSQLGSYLIEKGTAKRHKMRPRYRLRSN